MRSYLYTLALSLSLAAPVSAWEAARALPLDLEAPAGNPALATGDAPSLRASAYKGNETSLDLDAVLPLGHYTQGYMNYNRTEPWQLWSQSLYAGASMRLFSGTWTGARAEFIQRPGSQHMDLSIGTLYRPSRFLALAWDARHLLQSAYALPTEERQRLCGLGAAVFLDGRERVALHADASTHGFSMDQLREMRTTLGLRLGLGDTLRLEFSSGLSTASDGNDGLGPDSIRAYWKMGLGFALYSHRLQLEAGGENYSVKGPRQDPTLRMALALQWRALRDKVAPLAWIEKDSAGFHPHASETKIAEWQLLLHRSGPDYAAGPLIRRYAGQGSPPALIAFDAKDYGGSPLPAGRYAARLYVRDQAGNSSWSSWLYLEIL